MKVVWISNAYLKERFSNFNFNMLQICLCTNQGSNSRAEK